MYILQINVKISIGRYVNGMEKQKGIFSAIDLASYIKYKYSISDSRISSEISPLKLQKTLYFCFAYWGGFVRKGKGKQSELNITDSEYLFNEKIEAWVYGPVVPDVYHNNSTIKPSECSEIFKGKEYIKEFIDGILDNFLPASDFKLVEISHQDKCWINNFRKSEIFHNNEIPKEEIIKEYAKQI